MPAIDIATSEQLSRVESKLDRLLYILDSSQGTVNVAWISNKTGLAESTLRYSTPWILPNFGESQYPGTRKWDLKTWEEWNSRPVEERKSEYLTHKGDQVRRHYRKSKR